MGAAGRSDLSDVKRFWDAHPLFAGVSEHAPGTRPFYEEHRRMALHEHSGTLPPIFLEGVGPGVATLDVGCGIGFWMEVLTASGASVTGVDLSRTAAELTDHRLRLYGIDGRVVQGNAEDLPFSDRTFDHVNCQGVIHHAPDTEACVREFHRVLKDDGTVCFSVYLRTLAHRSRILFRMVRWLGDRLLEVPGRGRERLFEARTPEEFVRMYDGSENPLGKAFTHDEVEGMLGDLFRPLQVTRFFLPRESLPVDLPDALHRRLSRRFGLMIACRCRKVS